MQKIRIKKLLVFIFVFFAFAVHVLMTVLFLLPPNPMSNSYQKIVNWYMTPTFRQNWLLFAPEPPVADRYLWYRCRQEDDQWSSWKEPGGAVLSRLFLNPVSYQHKLYQTYGSINVGLRKKMRSLSEQGLTAEEIDVAVKKTDIYLLTARFIKKLCLRDGSQTTALQFRSVNVEITPYSKRHDFQPKNKIKVLDFPIMAIDGL